MISIDKSTNDLKISRGDTFTVRINLVGNVTLGPDDYVRFSVKKTIGSSDIVFSKDVQNPGAQYVDIFFDYEELEQLNGDVYRYDVTLISKDTRKIYTLIWDAALIIKGIAHHAEIE